MKTRKTKTSLSGPRKLMTIAGKKFSHVTCSRKKTDAKKKADSLRKKGSTARVVKTGVGYCVYKGPKSKKSASKMKQYIF